VLNVVSLDDRLLLDIEPSILFPLVDRLLGGNGQDDPPLGRPLTEIELRLATRIIGLFLEELRRAWKDVCDLELDVLKVESDPRLLRVLPSDEAVVQVGIELAAGQRRGMMRLGLPCRTLERINGREGRPAGNDAAPDSTVEIGITLAETPIAADQLAGLHVGDIITTEMAADSPAIVSIQGRARFRAKPGLYQGRKAIRITEPIEDSSPAEPK
jgi:flagellar motor switch protein FliM